MNKLFILLLISFNLLALEKSIEVSADFVSVDEKNSISHYQGDVVFEQGDINLKAEDIRIIKEISTVKGVNNYQITALGSDTKQASFLQNSHDKIYSSADRIIYSTKKKFIQLFGNAKLSQNGNNFSGEKIIYDIKNNKVSMQGSSKKRVKLKFKL